MHHGMGVSVGDRLNHQSATMRPKKGICDKIENYISDLGQWAVWRAIIMGQFLSMVLCFMMLINHYINSKYHFSLPTAQNLPHYVIMCMVYTTWMSCRGAGNGLFSVIRSRGWRYLLIALIDVEACTLITSSHRFTSLASIQLLDCVAIPVALALSCLVLGVRYRMVHIVGVSVCLMGVGCLVWAGINDNTPGTGGKNQLVGDMLCLGGAVLFSVTTVLQELAMKTVDIVEYLGMTGFFGTIISCLQIAVLEREQIILTRSWEDLSVVIFVVVYCITQFVFASLVPVILFESGATALQLALLTADSFHVISGMLIQHYKFHVLYFVSYSLTMTGIYIYAIKRTPMSANSRRRHIEPPVPDYRHVSHPDIGDVEMATSSGVSGVSGTLDMRASTLGSERETIDATSLPLSVSSDTAFTSFYGSQGNVKITSRSGPQISSNSYLNTNNTATIRSP